MTDASIVIPTFNRSALVSRAIDSALGQTYPCEVVVCDHGSTDATPQVVARYGDRIRYIRREDDRGPIPCWREGIAEARGEVVHINYDDDWIRPDFMEKCMALLREDVGFVYTRSVIHNPDTGRTAQSLPHPAGIRPMSDVVRYLLRTPLALSPGCALFRRRDALKNLLLEVPGASGEYGKNSGVGEDLLLFLLTSIAYSRYAYVAEPLAEFTAHPQSITVNAIKSGKYAALVSGYSKAKAYYYSRPGSEKPRARLLKIRDAITWQLACGDPLESLNSLRQLRKVL